MFWLPVGFLLGWFLAASWLVRKASEIAAMNLHGQINDWRDVLSASLGSGEADRSEKVKYVMDRMKVVLGG